MKYSNSNFSTTAATVNRPARTSAGRGDPNKASGIKVSGKGLPAPPDLLKCQRNAMYPLSKVVKVITQRKTM